MLLISAFCENANALVTFNGLKIILVYLQKTSLLLVSIITCVLYYLNLPFSHTIYEQKVRLVVTRLNRLTQGVVLDIWIVIIVVLIVAWLIGLNDGILGVWFIWVCIIWVYQLEEENEADSFQQYSPKVETHASTSTPIKLQVPSFGSLFNLPSPTGQFIDDPILELHFRLNKLEKEVETIKSDRIQQSISLFTLEHQLSMRIQTLEESQNSKSELQQTKMVDMAQSVQKALERESKKVEILEMYIWTIFRLLIAWNKFILKLIIPKVIYQKIKVTYHRGYKKLSGIYQRAKYWEHVVYKFVRKFQQES